MKHVFWDTCVLSVFLGQDRQHNDLPSVNKFICDAVSQPQQCIIYVSTISMAEILPSFLVGSKHKDFAQFADSMEAGMRQIAPDPNVMMLAARLRDLKYTKIGNQKETATRKLDVPDAIMLATAVMLHETYGIKLDEFHTYDKGGKRSLAGARCVPLLGLDSWCAQMSSAQKAVIDPILKISRCTPIHPTPDLPHV